MESQAGHAILEYAAPEHWSLGRWARRRWRFLLGLAVLISAYWWGPPVLQRARLLYLAHRCATCALPTDAPQVDLAPLPVSTSGEERVRFTRRGGDVEGRLVPEWSAFRSALGLRTPNATRIPVFLHERRMPDGGRWIVAVEYWATPYPLGSFTAWRDTVGFTVVEAPRLFRRPRVLHGWTVLPYFGDARAATTAIKAAPVDETDPTHVQFVVTVGGQDYVAEYWVRADVGLVQTEQSGFTLDER